jgi:hypothetical protein
LLACDVFESLLHKEAAFHHHDYSGSFSLAFAEGEEGQRVAFLVCVYRHWAMKVDVQRLKIEQGNLFIS